MTSIILLLSLMTLPESALMAPMPRPTPTLVACYHDDYRTIEITGDSKELKKFHNEMLNKADLKWENNQTLRAERKRALNQIYHERRLTINVAHPHGPTFTAKFLIAKTAREYHGTFKVLNPP